MNSDYRFSELSPSVTSVSVGSTVTVKEKHKSADTMTSTGAGQLSRCHFVEPLSNIDKSKKQHQNAGLAEILFLLVGAFPQETEPGTMRHYMHTVPTSTRCAERGLQYLTQAISSRSQQKYP